MMLDTSSDCSDTHTDQLADIVRRYQALCHARAQDLPEQQQEELRRAQCNILNLLYDTLKESLWDQVQRSLDRSEYDCFGQPIRSVVRNEVIHSMVLNMFSLLVIALPDLDLDQRSETRIQLLAAARVRDVAQIPDV
jgi:hypothetical protein